MTEIELKQRRSAYGRAYYARHKEEVKAKALAWYYAHKEHRAAYMKAYHQL